MNIIEARRILSLLTVLAVAGCGGEGGDGGHPPPPPPTVTVPDMGAYLATSRCADGRIAVLAGCSGVPQRASDPMLWRRADASNRDGQIGDSFVSDDGRYYVAGFSYPPNGIFSAAHNDGGDVEVVEGDHARIDYTRPLTNNPVTEGYWAGAGCPNGGTGWLLFDQYAPTGSWRSKVALLAGSTTRGACPPLGPFYTQWRLETVTIPFTVGGAPPPVALPTIVSEHYVGLSSTIAVAVERFIFAQGIGKVAWEAWGRDPPAATIACPGIAPWNGPPGPGWYLHDRRCWTEVVPGTTMTGDEWGWPGAGFVP